jgi:hypothetical protein
VLFRFPTDGGSGATLSILVASATHEETRGLPP